MGDLLWSLAGEGPELVQASRPGSPPLPPHLSCRHRRWQVTRVENLQLVHVEILQTTTLAMKEGVCVYAAVCVGKSREAEWICT